MMVITINVITRLTSLIIYIATIAFIIYVTQRQWKNYTSCMELDSIKKNNLVIKKGIFTIFFSKVSPVLPNGVESWTLNQWISYRYNI